ncbi:glutaredoxin 3 [Psychromonas sp. 14N.309.X.WAT.B.A12]|uniref:glutaredoxin 3 n=1 Tax=unclassified Psychromonas TaxID=2614957 RepID=UPI0025AF515A|nr:glutaredoxin 3 [Psychromonas sp. 14N.309.X.WAT.B.A12]MDN2664566.1 glutaredoxin 3 [Psychromonas sp. 14N.309.X.WAT.B.A12]
MAAITMYTTPYCPYCQRAKQLLDSKQAEYQEIDVSDRSLRPEMTKITGGTTVPQIIIDGNPIGGCDELYALERADKLDALLA